MAHLAIFAKREYNKDRLKKTTPTCFQCNSELIVISTVTEQLDGFLFPQITTTYRCTNTICQEEKDRQAVKREQFIREKAAADQERSDKRDEAKRARIKQVNPISS